MKIFAGRASRELAEELAEELKLTVEESAVEIFPDGNLLVQTGASVHGEEVVLVQTIWGRESSTDMMEMLFWLDALKRGDAAKITVIIPYFAYAKADKQEEQGLTALRARVVADCLQVAGADRVLMLDLHSPSIPGFFAVPVENLSALELIGEYYRGQDLRETVVVSPDAGFAKQARKYGAALGVETVIGDKSRPELNGDARLKEIIGGVVGKNCIIIDDFTTSAGTLVEVAGALRERGAGRIRAAAIHAPMGREALARVEASVIEELVVTNSTNNKILMEAAGRAGSKIQILPVMGLFAGRL